MPALSPGGAPHPPRGCCRHHCRSVFTSWSTLLLTHLPYSWACSVLLSDFTHKTQFKDSPTKHFAIFPKFQNGEEHFRRDSHARGQPCMEMYTVSGFFRNIPILHVLFHGTSSFTSRSWSWVHTGTVTAA